MAKVKQETKLVVKETNAPAVSDADGAWGTEGVDHRDVLIPKLLVMQGLSKFVTDEVANLGDIVDSVTGEIVGPRGKGVEIIPIMSYKTWVNFHRVGEKLSFIGIEPMTAQNADREWEEKQADGSTIRHDACLNFFVMLASDDGTSGQLPYLLSFRRASYKTGRKLATFFKQCQIAQPPVPPASQVWKLTGVKEENDEGVFYVFGAEPVRKSTAEEVARAKTWYLALRTNTSKVDNSDLEGSTPPHTVSRPLASETVNEARF